MTLIKSLLLGSSATLIAVASAQAADLPTRKGAPAAEYVKVCKIGGVAGFVIPGSDTCLKISGGVRFMADFGNTSTQYTQASTLAATLASATSGKYRNSEGFSTRADIGLDAASNTAYGLLTSHIDVHWDQGSGLEVAGEANASAAGGGGNTNAYINQAYLQWAGITAGIKPSYFDYIGGGETWNNIISPDHTGTGTPLVAYTATFGGGFAATIDAEQYSPSGSASYSGIGGTAQLGQTTPDFVASLDLTQGWGTAHLSGVAHNVHVEALPTGPAANDLDQWGFGLNGGIGFNLPMLGAGDLIKLQGTYTREAMNYSGFNSAGWGTGLNLNGNGLLYQLTDAYTQNGGVTWSVPTTWGFAAVAELHLTPQFEIAPEISYGSISWSNRGAATTLLEGNATSWFGGAAFNWTPVTNLTFNLDIVYQESHWDSSIAGNVPAGSASGVNVRAAVERDF